MNVTCADEQLSSAASIVLSLWFSLSGLAAVTGNAVVLWLFFKNESLRTISNRFLASLSVADFLVGLVIDPVWIVIVCLIQPLDNQLILWNVVNVMWIHTTAATTFNLCCVSVDRFIAIRFPFRYQDIVTTKSCYSAIILVWLISLGLPFTTISEDRHNSAELWLSLVFITFVVPLFIVSFCYICIFKAARKQFRRILPGQNPRNYDENIRVSTMKNFKAIKTVGFVLGVFIITWMPSLVLLLVNCYYLAVNHHCKDMELNAVLWPWAEAIAFTSSAINPWVYYFRNTEFRQAFRRTFHWLPCRPTVENAQEHDLKPDRDRIVRNDANSGNLALEETEL